MEPSPLPVDKDPVPPPTAPCVAIWAAASPQVARLRSSLKIKRRPSSKKEAQSRNDVQDPPTVVVCCWLAIAP